MDFTRTTLKALLLELKSSGYEFYTISQFLKKKLDSQCRELILRHDVDRSPVNSLYTASMEHDLDIRGTYYFRWIRRDIDVKIIREIADMGHEIGYHYEDIDLISRRLKIKRQESEGTTEIELATLAFKSFRENLSRLKAIVPIKTICMHGSPMSRYDSRVLWKYFDYRDLGIESEPYFDFSFDKMLYLTDTGRRWDGSAVSMRDRVYRRDENYYEQWVRKPGAGSALAMREEGWKLQQQFRFVRTTEILTALKAGHLPEKVFLTIHPQRWNNELPAWIAELMLQSIKNRVKYILNKRSVNT